MHQEFLIGLISIFVMGISAQWLAWRFRWPAILLLLLFGFAAGPMLGILQPDHLLGELLFPAISLAVAVILFEGGLSLKIGELREAGRAVRNLVSLGVLLTWSLSTAAAYFILGFDLNLALLLGAILVVTGPTVIVPLLRQIRPPGRVGSVAKWEGIINDPIGAVLAVLVFEAIIASGVPEATSSALFGLLRSLLTSSLVGIAGAGLIILLLRRFWIPDFLQNPVVLTTVLLAFGVSDLFQAESGLLTVTLMGIILSNQPFVVIEHIAEFKENLRVLLLASLFILLAARLPLADFLNAFNPRNLLFVAALILLVRPISTGLTTIRSELTWRERLFIAWLAPRGIVAAAVASVFSLRLVEAGYPQAEQLVPVTFLVIVTTVTLYGITLPLIAGQLGLSDSDAQGTLIVGAHSWAREIGQALQAAGYPVLMVDRNERRLAAARLAGLPTFYANVVSEHALDKSDLSGIKRLLALTANDEVNALANLNFSRVFTRAEVYQLPQENHRPAEKDRVSQRLSGRQLFGEAVTYRHLTQRFAEGAVIKTTNLTSEFDFADFQHFYGQSAIPLFLISRHGELHVFTVDNPPKPQPGDKIISLADPVDDKKKETAKAVQTELAEQP